MSATGLTRAWWALADLTREELLLHRDVVDAEILRRDAAMRAADARQDADELDTRPTDPIPEAEEP